MSANVEKWFRGARRLESAAYSKLFGKDIKDIDALVERYKELMLDDSMHQLTRGMDAQQTKELREIRQNARENINNAFENAVVEMAEELVDKPLLEFIGKLSISPADLVAAFAMVGKSSTKIPRVFDKDDAKAMEVLYEKFYTLEDQFADEGFEWLADYVAALRDVVNITQLYARMRSTQPAMFEEMSRGTATLSVESRDLVEHAKELADYKDWLFALRQAGFPEQEADAWARRIAQGEFDESREQELSESLLDESTDPDTSVRYNPDDGVDLEEDDLIDRALEFFADLEQSTDELKPLGQQKAETVIQNLIREHLVQRAELLMKGEIEPGDERARVYVILHNPGESEWLLARKAGYRAPIELSDEFMGADAVERELESGEFVRGYRRVGIENEALEQFANVKPGFGIYVGITPELWRHSFIVRQGPTRDLDSIEVLEEGDIDDPDERQAAVDEFTAGYDFIDVPDDDLLDVQEEQGDDTDQEEEKETPKPKERLDKKQRFPIVLYGLLSYSENWPRDFIDYAKEHDPEVATPQDVAKLERVLNDVPKPSLSWSESSDHAFKYKTSKLDTMLRALYWPEADTKTPIGTLRNRFSYISNSFGFEKDTAMSDPGRSPENVVLFHKPILGDEALRFERDQEEESMLIDGRGTTKAKLDKMRGKGYTEEEIDLWRSIKTEQEYEDYLEDLNL